MFTEPRAPRYQWGQAVRAAVDLYNDGSLPGAEDDQLLIAAANALEGTPDVQHAARARIGEKTVGYIRVVEGGGSLFAAIPRTDKPTGNQFEGEFTGRMRRLADVRMFAWITSAKAIRMRSPESCPKRSLMVLK